MPPARPRRRPGAAVRSRSQQLVFTAASAGTYFIGIKYTTSDIVGSGPAATKFVSPYNYLYKLSTALVSGSTSKLKLNHK
jgi:hypothetical protein